jgi:hypothetical protein
MRSRRQLYQSRNQRGSKRWSACYIDDAILGAYNIQDSTLRRCVTVIGSLWETALIVEAGLTGGYVPARV